MMLKSATDRCGFNHLVKFCKVPATIKCRRCSKQGHIENAFLENASDLESHKITSNTESPHLNASEDPDNTSPKFMGHISTCESRLPIEIINTEFKECIALWDSGSAINLVDNQWARHNGIEGKPGKLKFKVVDGTVKEIESKAYNT